MKHQAIALVPMERLTRWQEQSTWQAKSCEVTGTVTALLTFLFNALALFTVLAAGIGVCAIVCSSLCSANVLRQRGFTCQLEEDYP